MARSALALLLVACSSGASGTALDDAAALDGAAAPVRSVAISEIMYHPVLEDTDEELHEFIELHNPSAAAVSLADWKLRSAKGVSFTFPAGASIGPGGFLVVAKNARRLSEVAKYALDLGRVTGDYAGQLDNGGDQVSLLDARGAVVDTVKFQDAFPWPIAADALGAGESWLPPSVQPLSAHQYMGVSLERISFTSPADDVANWAPSPLDGATPGRPNAAASTPLAVASWITAAPAGADGPIRKEHSVAVTARFGGPAAASVKDVTLEYFVDAVDRSDEPRSKVAMTAAMDGFRAVLPPQPDNSIVRYRVLADRGSGQEPLAPRPSDPFAFHGYFVGPPITSQSRVYQLFISPVDWGRMWTNVNFPTDKSRVDGCNVRESWQSRVPAVFVYEGRVYDAMVRYQGSRWGRLSSVPIPSWPYPGPMGGPTPVKAMSWSIKLPRYAPKIDGTRTVLLNKMTYGCPNLAFPVGFRLYKAAGIPTADARYARFYVNGGYYHYAMQLDHLDDLWAAALEPAGQPPGDLLKSTGCTCDEGPWGWGDERVLQPFCNYSKEQRYATTYKRYTYEWRGGKDVMALIEGLDAARKAGGQTLRAYLADNFDVDLVLAQIAIRNWAGTSDDMFQNHFLYRRPKDGKWVVVPYDLELEFGDRGGVPPTASFYIGEEGNPNNRSMWWNYLKDAFFKAYRAEYGKKLAELSTTILEPGNFAKVVDESATLFSVSDLMQAASKQMSCDVPGQVSKMKKWALDRDASLKAGIH